MSNIIYGLDQKTNAIMKIDIEWLNLLETFLIITFALIDSIFTSNAEKVH